MSPTDRPTVPETDGREESLGQALGRYKLLEKVGEGGFGAVYVADQKEPVKRRVALKIIKLGMDTRQVVARFEAERQALAMMDHPNIAKVLDAGSTESGRPYFVMELVRGIRITDYCDQERLSTRDRLELFIKVCQAIQHAHQKGIIHRDIKPSNILVTLHDGSPVPKVIDFGIAKATQQDLTDKTVYTQLQQFIGTPAYMSPEQAEMSGLDVDTRSDVYSLGVLLYELLVGSTPFDPKELMSQGIDAMRKTIREKEPARPSTKLATLKREELTTTAKRRSVEMGKLLHQLRGDLDWMVMKCLEKDRRRRYETANGLAIDIQRHLSNEPVAARPPSAAYKAQKFVRRNKGMVTAAALVLAVLVLGIVGSTWQAIRATEAEREQARLSHQAEAEAATVRQLVEAQKHQLYVANINLAQQAWDQNNFGRLRELLAQTADYPDRGFEWYYWQRQAHRELEVFKADGWSVNAVAFSPDGRRILTGGEDGAKVWDALSGKQLLTLKGHTNEVSSVAFSPDGRRIVTGGDDGVARVWDATTGEELITLEGHSNSVGFVDSVVRFSPDGQRIATASTDGTAKVWDASNGQRLLTLKGHRDRLKCVAFSPDNRRIVTGSNDRTAKVWDAASGQEIRTLSHGIWVSFVTFSPDGQKIVTQAEDGTIRVWDATSGSNLLMLNWHCNEIDAVALSADGQRIVTGDTQGFVKVWDASNANEPLTLRAHSDWVVAVAFDPSGRRIATAGKDATANVWDSTSGEKLFTFQGHRGRIESVTFSPDGRRIATASYDLTAKVWDGENGRELLTLTGHSNLVWYVTFSRDGRRLATAGLDGTARVWDAQSGREVLKLSGHRGRVFSVAFSLDGKRIASSGEDGTARVWDAGSGKELLTFNGHRGPAWSAAFSPDGHRIATAGDGIAKVWDVASGRELVTLKRHGGSIRSIAFSPDGRRILTASFDGTAKVLDTDSGLELLTLKMEGGWVCWSAAFSPDGRRIVTGSEDNTARVWEAASPQQVVAWQPEER